MHKWKRCYQNQCVHDDYSACNTFIIKNLKLLAILPKTKTAIAQEWKYLVSALHYSKGRGYSRGAGSVYFFKQTNVIN